MWYSVVDISLQNQYIAMLHSSIDIGIARGQYYWILGALFGIVLTLFNTVGWLGDRKGIRLEKLLLQNRLVWQLM